MPRARAATVLTLLAVAAPACLGSARAGPDPSAPVRAVIEMFTSQGCSACLPADRIAGELSREAGLLVLTLPVTYWDYLGWKDTLAEHAFSERQRGYAEQRRQRQVATPQAVVNGRDAVAGSDGGGLGRLVAEAAGLPVGLRVSERGERIVVEVEAQAYARPAEVWLLPVARSRPVVIGRGENGGRVAVYANVVRGVLRVGAWTGAPARFELPRAAARINGADSYAVLLQAGTASRPGRILGAAKGPGL